jgi:hypothetical protein
MDVCVFCVRFFCFYIVSSETASRPNKNINEDLSLDKPLHVIYKVSKLAYRIWVILIVNIGGKIYIYIYRVWQFKLFSNNCVRVLEIDHSCERNTISGFCRSQWPRGLRHELSSPASTLRSWVRIPVRHGCLCVLCAFFLFLHSLKWDSQPT